MDSFKRIDIKNVTTNFINTAANLEEWQTNHIKFTSAVDKCEENFLEEVDFLIKEKGFDMFYAVNLIEYSMKIRPLNRKKLLDALVMIEKKYNYKIVVNSTLFFKSMLRNQGIIENKPNEDYLLSEEQLLCNYPIGSVEDAIKNDNIDIFVICTSHPDFNPRTKRSCTRKSPLHFVNNDSGMNIENVSYMQMIAFYGAVKCFKNAILDGSFDESETETYAIAGGNYEIIKLLEQRGHKFDFCFSIAVKYHRNELCDWLLNNYDCEEMELFETKAFYNEVAFYFFIKNNLRINFSSFNLALIESASTGDFDTLKYLIEEKGAKLDSRNRYSETVLIKAAEKGNLKLVKYLVEKHNLDIEEKTHSLSTPLIVASAKGQKNVVKYLVEDCSANIKAVDCLQWTALHFASLNGHLEVVKYLIEECHLDVEAVDEKKQTPLHLAAYFGQLPVVKYLVETCNANVYAKAQYDTLPYDIAVRPTVKEYLKSKMQ